MSYYAFFKGWLLPSLHFSCLDLKTFFALRYKLETLANNLGCFPFDKESSHSMSVYTLKKTQRIRSFKKICKKKSPSFNKSSSS